MIRDRAIPLEEDLLRIRQVSSEDVRQFLEKYLQRDRCGIAIVGDTRLY